MNVARFDNARSGVVPSGVWFVVPAILAAVGLSGVTWKPVLGRRAARLELELARERAARRDAASDELRRFEDRGGDARLDGALASIAALVPAEASPVDVSALCSLIATRHGIELSNAVVGAPQPTEFAQIADRVVRVDVEVRGLATPAQLIRFAPDFRAAGFPVDVLELTLGRRDVSDPRFTFRLVLGLYHRAARLEPAVESAQPDSASEPRE